MDAIFALGNRASAEEVRGRLTDPPSYSAVRAMLVKLEAKGFVRHREEGLRYVYEPMRSRAAEQRSAIERLTRVFFGGSARQTVTALLQQERWTSEDLEALRRQIDQVQRGTKQ